MKRTAHRLVSQRVVGGSTISSYEPYEVEVPDENLVFGAPTPVISQRDFDGEISYVVTFDWSSVVKVDRPNTGGIETGPGTRGRKLAERLAAATRAGVVFSNACIVSDVNAKTYVEADRKVMGKYLNADLKRLGF